MSTRSSWSADRPVRRSDVRAVDLDGDISLYDPRGRNAVTLNATASAIWRLLDGERDLAEITAAVAADFGVAPDQIDEQVAATLARLRELELVS